MKNRNVHIIGAIAIILVLSSLLGPLSFLSTTRQSGNPAETQAQPAAATFPNLNITLHGAGATFPVPLVSLWASQYHQSNPTVTVSYQSIGSGKGINSLINKTGDFAASDAPLNSGQRILAPNALHIPETIGSVVAAYNLVGAGIKTGLNLTGDVLARIYLGSITTWNDPAIQSINPGVVLPNNAITVVHRSDGSGTTFIWTSFLCLSSTLWCSAVGKGTVVNWPVGLGAQGNPGVASLVNATANSIGYVELNYALQHGLTYGQIQNPSGNYVLPSLATTRFAVENYTSTNTLPAGSGDWSSVSMLNQGGVNTYPIASFTYLLVYSELNVVPSMDLNETAQFSALVAFLNWVITTGQTFSPQLSYVQLPPSVVAVDQASINSITYTIASKPVGRTFSLRADAKSGWNLTNPGPTIQVVSGDSVTLNLLSNDGLQHQWYIDFDNNQLLDANEQPTSSPTFSSTTTPATFPFTPAISTNIPLAGTVNPGYHFTYRDVLHPSLSGTIIVLPQQTAAVIRPASSLTSSLAPVIDSSRVTTIGTLLIDSRAQTVSGNVAIAVVDSVSGSLTFTKGFLIPSLSLFQQQLKFITVAAVLPYAVSSNILVQLATLGISASAQEFTVSRSLDINGFGVVNILDAAVAAGAYNCAIGQSCYNPKADFKAYGIINILDLTLFANFYSAHAFH